MHAASLADVSLADAKAPVPLVPLERLRDDASSDAPTDRAHEYVLIARKASRGMDADATRALLDALARDGFALRPYGSFARWLDGKRDVQPNDVDLLCAPDDREASRLMRWFEAGGFRIEPWNAPVAAPISLDALACRYYFRACRVDATGATLQVDVAVARDQLSCGLRAAALRGASPASRREKTAFNFAGTDADDRCCRFT